MKQKSKVEGNYPQTQVVTIPIEMWTPERQEEYIKERLNAHFSQEPSCSDEQRWKKEDTFAVMKKGRKSASRVLSTNEEAEAWVMENGGDEIQHRKGEYSRCQSYCNVHQWCPYYLDGK